MPQNDITQLKQQPPLYLLNVSANMLKLDKKVYVGKSLGQLCIHFVLSKSDVNFIVDYLATV